MVVDSDLSFRRLVSGTQTYTHAPLSEQQWGETPTLHFEVRPSEQSAEV